MPNAHTDSMITVHHDDGSWTETTEITYFPTTKAEKATGVAVLGALGLIALAPAIWAGAEEWRNARRLKRELAKTESTD